MRRLPTTVLLQCAAIAVVFAVLFALVNPLLTGVAAVSPVLYALFGSLTMTGPVLSYRLLGGTGTITLTAALMSLIVVPLSALGFLVLPALILPALAMDAVLLLTPRRWRTGMRIAIAALAGALVIFGISLPIIDPDQLHPVAVAAILLCRIAGYQVAGLFACALARVLSRALGRPNPTASGIVRSGSLDALPDRAEVFGVEAGRDDRRGQ